MNQKKKKNFWHKAGVYIFVFAFVWFFYEPKEETVAPETQTAVAEQSGRCIKVIDGDTIDVKVGGRSQRVRILGVDCMESHNEDKQAQQARTFRLSQAEVLRLSQQATASAKKKLLGKEVVLAFSGGEAEEDRYNRLLCYVEVEGEDFGLFLLNEGLAEARREPHARSFQYGKASGQAKRAGIGIFKAL